MAKTNEKGFGVVELIMGVVIVVLLGAVVYLYTQANNKNNSSNDSKKSSSASVSPLLSQSEMDSAAVLAKVKAFYKLYLTDYNSTTGPLFDSYVSKGYLTQKAEAQEKSATGLDPTSCSQGALDYEQYSFSTPVLKDSTGKMTVSGLYEYSGKVTIGIDLVKEGATWKINEFNCS